MSIFITGIGVVSSLGFDVEENYNSLLNYRSGIAPVKFLQSNKNVLVGEVKLSNKELLAKGNLKTSPLSRTSILGVLAAKQCWGANQHSNLINTAVISSTSVAGMDVTEQYYSQIAFEGDNTNLRALFAHDNGLSASYIAKELGIKGYINTLSTACSSGANAIMLGARMIESGKADRVLVGGTDAMSSFTINGFSSLGIYDSEWCRPFDKSRKGLNLGEGSAFLLLEGDKSLTVTDNKPLVKLAGWANTADAYHQTASSPEGIGATKAISGALKKTTLNPEDISYVNAHGTGTPNNDMSESQAMKNIFGEKVPPFSSTKSYTGHTLAASGAIEAVFSILAIQNNLLFPNLNFKDCIEETGLTPVKELTNTQSVNAVLSNSFGFGGNNTSLIFQNI